ncbi:hypothetical protein SS50377_28106 [Spironucleus salmonicida]|uniref:Uncharacterized protein n=1 Tax=Spironucleus salmonicida TaxID=348837 RepID=V6LPV7_9EUKA|nr:hypothetical protein SS50377_28106 [Spironucleus salmonicida]|eukprot:EST42789.1 Hypothetical protein SS50377_17558 [Spironucleus salmonicida]
MQLPVHESMAYYFSKLSTIYDQSEIQNQAQHYEQCFNDFYQLTTYQKPKFLVNSIKMHAASILIQTRESERERQEKGRFPDDAVVKDSYQEKKAQKFSVENHADFQVSPQQLEMLILAPSVDFTNIKSCFNSKNPEVDDATYEIVEIIGYGGGLSVKE